MISRFSYLHCIWVSSSNSQVHRRCHDSAGRGHINHYDRRTSRGEVAFSSLRVQIGWWNTPPVFALQRSFSGWVASTRLSSITSTVVVKNPLILIFTCTMLYWLPLAPSISSFAEIVQNELTGEVLLLAFGADSCSKMYLDVRKWRKIVVSHDFLFFSAKFGSRLVLLEIVLPE